MSNRPDGRLYLGRVMHLRMLPLHHQFRYRVFSLLMNIDRLDEACKRLRFLSHNRFNLLSFFDADHGARDGSSLREWVDQLHAEKGLPSPSRIELLSFPRLLGFAFNPLSVYFCFDAQEELGSILYEVKNTYGDQVAYLLSCSGNVVRHSQDKQMYVSPFIEMDQTYRFTLRCPDEKLSLRIKQGDGAQDVLIATHNGDARPLDDRNILLAVLKHPMMTLKVVAGIHWEALRLFLKGVKFNRYSKSQIFAKKTHQA